MTSRNAISAAASAAAAAAAAPYVAAKMHASRHRVELEASTRCACFFCFRAFAFSEIKAWTDANTTALCPGCGVDAVLGDASLASISDGFLRKMHQHHFAYRSK
jgi:heterodisulfide reductase subunit A-like polyferredoxin